MYYCFIDFSAIGVQLSAMIDDAGEALEWVIKNTALGHKVIVRRID